MTKPALEIGDTVIFNDVALKIIWEGLIGLGHMKTLKMKVKGTGGKPGDPDNAVWVDSREFLALPLSEKMFDIVQKKEGSLYRTAYLEYANLCQRQKQVPITESLFISMSEVGRELLVRQVLGSLEDLKHGIPTGPTTANTGTW